MRLYKGQTLTEENYNKIVDLISGIENKEIQINDNQMSFLDGDDFEGSVVSVDRDEKGDIISLTQEIRETTDRAPFETFDNNTTYENEIIYNVDLSSDYQVLRKSNGTIIPSTDYSLNERGQITFLQEHNEELILVNGLDYWMQKTVYIGRDEGGNIKKLSMDPIKSVEERFEQDLLPVLLSNRDEVDLDGFTNFLKDAEAKYDNELYLLFTNWKKGLTYTSNEQYLRSFEIDFKRQLEVKSFLFSKNNVYSGIDPFSFDIWGSNDKTTWERLLRIRDNDENDVLEGTNKFEYRIPTPKKFRYIKYEGLGSGQLEVNKIQVFGYHPEGLDMRNRERILGKLDWGFDGYNGTVKMTPGNKGAINDDLSERNFGFNKVNSWADIIINSYLQYNFNEPVILEKYKFRHHRYLPKKWEIQGSNDGKSFKIIDEQEKHDWEEIDDYENEMVETFHIDKPKSFKFYRIIPELPGREMNKSEESLSEFKWIELIGRKGFV